MGPPMTLLKQIEQFYNHLSPAERKVADYLAKNEQVVVTHSAAELAMLVHVSKATVSRTFRSLGYHNHQHLRSQLRQERENGLPIVIGDHPPTETLQQECRLLTQAHQEFDDVEPALIQQLLRARKVYVVGFRNGHPVADHLRQQLAQLRNGVRLLPTAGQTMGEELVDINSQDLVLVMGFRRRVAGFNRLLTQLTNRLPKQAIVLFTDPSGHQYRRQVGTMIHCPLGLDKPMDNYSVVFSLIARLVNNLYQAKDPIKRIESIRDIYDELDELEKPIG